ncbi:hypothetical protein FACS189443_4720 [Planctomycetales bacterium]|nr:hypothetical protein FACS189443_4720 [Planctomycetales bacterium]
MSASHNRFSFFRAIPNITVFLLLCGIIYAGHHTGWKIPKFSELIGTAAPQDTEWCGDHLVPEAECVECKPDLIPKEKDLGFCDVHGVAQCVNDNPELAQVKDKQPALPKYDTGKAVGLINRTENSSRDTLYTKRVQFTTADAVRKAGINVGIANEGAVTETISANGELMFDPYRVAMLSSKSAGTVAAVLKHTGDKVAAGDVLALVDASQVGQLKAQFLKDFVNLRLQQDNSRRVKAMAASSAASQQEIIQADSDLQQALAAVISTKQFLASLGFNVPDPQAFDNPVQLSERLQYLGIAENVIKELPPTAKNDNLLPIISPFDGVVANTDIVLGTVVDTSKTLLTIADPQRMWIMLNVRQEDAPYIRLGQQVRFTSDNGDQKAGGAISWISPSVDDKTRALKVRAEFENPDGNLRNHIFGYGQIVLREEPNAVLVPQEAVQATTDSQYVFVRDKDFFEDNRPKMFYVRQVRLGAKAAGVNAGKVEILAGVLPGEVVVTKGSNVLLAHLLRSSLGAGCCAED